MIVSVFGHLKCRAYGNRLRVITFVVIVRSRCNQEQEGEGETRKKYAVPVWARTNTTHHAAAVGGGAPRAGRRARRRGGRASTRVWTWSVHVDVDVDLDVDVDDAAVHALPAQTRRALRV